MINRMTRRSLIVLIIAAWLLAACTAEPTQQPTDAPQPTAAAAATPTPEGEQPTAQPQPPERPPATSCRVDGIIDDGEYAHQATIGQVQLWWSNDAESLCLAMEAAGTGWIAVGIDPENRMEGANYLIGVVADGEAQMWDAFGTAPVGANHPPDTDLGGTDDVVAYEGVEEEGVTRFEVQIPLDSGDEFDRPLQPGSTYPVITAVGSSDAYDSHHTSRAAGEITLD